MILKKEKRVKLKPKALKKLNQDIFDRDNSKCVVCGRFVSSGHKFHHEPCGSKKSDEINKGVVLCDDCHFERHFGKKCLEVKKIIVNYLKSKYK